MGTMTRTLAGLRYPCSDHLHTYVFILICSLLACFKSFMFNGLLTVWLFWHPRGLVPWLLLTPPHYSLADSHKRGRQLWPGIKKNDFNQNARPTRAAPQSALAEQNRNVCFRRGVGQILSMGFWLRKPHFSYLCSPEQRKPLCLAVQGLLPPQQLF